MSQQAKRLAEDKALALETVHSQNALLHASGHDSRQVILALNSAVAVLKRTDRLEEADGELVDMLQSSADYLSEIVSTTISGANIAASNSDFVALSSFRAQALVEPLSMMFKTLFANKKLALDVEVEGEVVIISDKPLLMRALANLLGNSYKYTATGGASIHLAVADGCALITLRDSGCGMPGDVVAALNDGTATRLRANESMQGTGSGFGAAKKIIETLCGSLEILSSNAIRNRGSHHAAGSFCKGHADVCRRAGERPLSLDCARFRSAPRFRSGTERASEQGKTDHRVDL